jgi:hypothetical protein
MKKLLCFSLLTIICFLANHAFSQVQPDSSKLVRVETLDGNDYVGVLLAEDSLKVEIETALLGKIVIPRTSIKVMSPVQPADIRAGKLWAENTQATRYFWSPNGYGLKKGEGYYQNIWVFWNQASVGVTDYFSIGAGIIPLFFFGGTSSPVWLVPKFSIPVVKDKFNLGVGALTAVVLGEENTGFGIVYGLGTIGNRNNNLTLGLGYGYAAGEWASTPVITLGGMARVGPKGYLLTENFYIGIGDDYLALIMIGGRTVTKKIGIDYGLFIPRSPGMDRFIGIPWLGITIPFGKKY